MRLLFIDFDLCLFLGIKKLLYLVDKGVLNKNWRRPTLPLVAVPSALVGLTSVFGMGTGEPHR